MVAQNINYSPGERGSMEEWGKGGGRSDGEEEEKEWRGWWEGEKDGW